MSDCFFTHNLVASNFQHFMQEKKVKCTNELIHIDLENTEDQSLAIWLQQRSAPLKFRFENGLSNQQKLLSYVRLLLL